MFYYILSAEKCAGSLVTGCGLYVMWFTINHRERIFPVAEPETRHVASLLRPLCHLGETSSDQGHLGAQKGTLGSRRGFLLTWDALRDRTFRVVG